MVGILPRTGGKDGQYVSSWRIRPIGYAHIAGESILSGKLERLWGGKAHYCLGVRNIAMTIISVFFMVFMTGGFGG